MIKYRFLGKGYTDENGVAHMTEDADGQSCNGYTGTGRGLTDIIASTDDSSHISEGSLQSETYEVWDTLFYDNGLTESSKWLNYADRLTVTPSSDGTTLFRDASSGTGYYIMYNRSASQNIDFTLPFSLEFEIDNISSKTQVGIDFIKNGSDNNKTFNQMNINNGDSVKITFDGETIKVYKNGSSTSTDLSLSLSTPINLAFFVTATNYMTFKNLKMYSI
jgi:hypothetical protein